MSYREIRTLTGALPSGGLELVQPIAFEVEILEGQVIASVPDLDEYAVGETEEEAVEHLRRLIVDLYWHLAGDQDRLGPDLLEVWERLRSSVKAP